MIHTHIAEANWHKNPIYLNTLQPPLMSYTIILPSSKEQDELSLASGHLAEGGL